MYQAVGPTRITITANCRYLGAAAASDRDESRFVVVRDAAGNEAIFHFGYSAFARVVENVVADRS